jgi:anti-sigma B factor antagonist
MERHHQILLAEIVTRAHYNFAFTGNRGKLEIRCRIANLQRHFVPQSKLELYLENAAAAGWCGINLLLTFSQSSAVNISRMSDQPLNIEQLQGSREGIQILRLSGPLTLQNLFGFQSKLRADNSRALILDFSAVPLADSAGIGALVGAYVSRQKDGRTLGLVGVNQRIHQALEVTRVENFFRFYGTIAEAEQAA